MSENGDTNDEASQQSIGGTRVNGEVNGSYNEPMEVDESMEVDEPVKPVKKINSSDINCISEVAETDSNSLSEPSEQMHSNSDDKLSKNDSVIENEVPEKEEGASSNGFNEHHTEEEDSHANAEEKNQDEDDNQDQDEGENLDQEGDENQDQGDENHDDNNDDVVMMEEEEAHPFAGDESAGKDVENVEENTEGETPEEKQDENEQVDEKDDQDIDSSLVKENSIENEKNENQENENAEQSSIKSAHENSENDAKEPPGGECQSATAESTKSEDGEKGESEKMEVDGEKSEESLEKSKTEEESEKTPDKSKKKKTQQQPINITPRRSSRNVNKPKTYIDEPDIKGSSNTTTPKKANEDPDIEEIVPQDPLAMDSPVSDKKNKKTVVVNDPKRLVEIATGSKQTKPGKKEPTLVIIDTNSILSGRGPVPVSPSSPLGHSTSITGPNRAQGYSVLPVALPAQGMYPHPLNKSQVKPMVMSSTPSATPSPPPASSKTPPVILPSLTDDMYVVEAPSFIVPYVYEKPPIKPLKNFVDQVEQAIKEIKAQFEKDRSEEDK